MQRQSAEWRLRVWRLAHALRRAIDTVICKREMAMVNCQRFATRRRA